MGLKPGAGLCCAGPSGAAGSGRSSVTVRPLPSNIAERGSTERNIHPELLSPCSHPCGGLKRFIKENRYSTVPADNRSNQAERRPLPRNAVARGPWSARAQARRRPSASAGDATRRKAGDRAWQRASKSGWPTRDFRSLGAGPPGSSVSRRSAVPVGRRIFGLDRGERDRVRSELGGARPDTLEVRPRRWRLSCVSLGLSPLSGHHDKHAHWCAFRFTKACGACIARFSTEKIRHAGFEIVEQRLQ